MKTRVFSLVSFLIVFTLIFGGLFSLNSIASEIYKDPKGRFTISPPIGWTKIDEKTVLTQGKEMLPDNLKDWVKPENVEVMYMDISKPARFGSNMNIVLSYSGGVQFDQNTFNVFKDMIKKQYESFKLEGYTMGRIKDLTQRADAYLTKCNTLWQLGYKNTRTEKGNVGWVAPDGTTYNSAGEAYESINQKQN